jgi:signal peptidase
MTEYEMKPIKRNAKGDKKRETRWQKGKRITLNILLTLAVLLVLLAAVYAVFFNREDAFIFGYKPFVISSESMEPTYSKYGIVLIKRENFEDIQVGEPIAFKADALGGKPAFHRVLEITAEGIVTKGDANKIADSQLITAETYLGRAVWHTNVTAKLIPLLQTPKGILFIVVLPVVLIILIVIAVKLLGVQRWNRKLEREREKEERIEP